MTPSQRPRIGLPVVPLALFLVVTLIAAVSVAVAGPLASLLLILMLLAVFAAAFATAFMPGVVLGLYFFIGIYKGGIQPYLPIDVSVVLAVLNILQIIPVVLDHQPRHISRAGITLWLTLGLLTLGGILYAPDQRLGVAHVALFWGLVVVPILPAAVRVGSSPRYVKQLLWSVFAMGLPMVVLGIAQVSASERLVLLGANTIDVARAALLVPLVGISFVIRQRFPLATAATVVLIPASLVVALASGSRGPLLFAILLGVVALIRYLSRPRQVNWRLTGLVTTLALGSLVIVSLAGPVLPILSTQRFSLFADFIDRGLSGDLNTSTGDTSAGERVQLFGLAVSLFERQPLLGVGPAGFEVLSPRYLSPIEADVYPHNAFLQFAAEYGLVGLALFVALLGLAVTRSIPPSISLTTVRLIFAFLFLNAMVSGDVFTDREMWGFLMLLLLIDEQRMARAEEPEIDWPGVTVPLM
jgi:O-antigen ligase